MAKSTKSKKKVTTKSKSKTRVKPKNKAKPKIKPCLLILCLIIPFVAGALGSRATDTSVNTWYETINKPSFNPPNWVFAPAWTILYVLMGLSLYLVLNEKKDFYQKGFATIVFMSQLFLNTIWSFAFFLQQSPKSALIIIFMLLIAIVLMIKEFDKINKTAAKLLLPYLAWVSFATILNLAVFLLN